VPILTAKQGSKSPPKKKKKIAPKKKKTTKKKTPSPIAITLPPEHVESVIKFVSQLPPAPPSLQKDVSAVLIVSPKSVSPKLPPIIIDWTDLSSASPGIDALTMAFTAAQQKSPSKKKAPSPDLMKSFWEDLSPINFSSDNYWFDRQSLSPP